jgi:cold shock CspA family protein
MAQGKIRALSPRGFGLIEGEDEVVHFPEVVVKEANFESLRERQPVEYEALVVGGRKEATFVRTI